MLEPGQTVSHFLIQEKLGQGGMGAVYKARDTRLERLVALKVLSPELVADQNSKRRFMQEARAASALNHPNIITIYEISSWDDQDYIAMEFVEGRTLRPRPGDRPDIAELIPTFRQIAEALSAAHSRGIVHRDLKPDNIMLRQDGYVKILDFGLARLAKPLEDDSQTISLMTSPGAVVGTPRYMSPEQVQGDLVEAASDIFSLGMVFYELVTGTHPFHRGSKQGLLRGILVETPVAPRQLNPEVSAALDRLIQEMLSKEKSLRPAAGAVHAALEAMDRPAVMLETPAAPQRESQTVGRQEELSQLREVFRSVSAGGGIVLCISGEPGIGKTTVAEDFLTELGSRYGSCWIGRGRCSERLGGAEAYLPILEGLESLLRGESGDEAARAMSKLAPTWYLHVAPALGDTSIETLTKEAKMASHERMRREFTAFFEELSRTRPVVLFFDDLHWSDASTCDLISYLSGRLSLIRALIIATFRPADLAASRHPFQEVKLDMERRGLCREMPLGFLEREHVDRYVAAQFPGHRFPPEFLDVIQQKTEGSPLFIAEMLRYLRDRGILAQQDGHWVLTQPIEDLRKEIPASTRNMIELKIRQFDAEDHKLLLAAAVQGVKFDSAVLAKVLERDPADIEERLQQLEVMHEFVRMAGEHDYPDHTFTVRYRFVHVLYQNALYASLAPSRRASMSREIAEAILGFSGDKVRALAADLAYLFETARDFARASHFFLAAARNAARVFAYPEAAALCERGLKALAVLPESAERDKQELAFSLALGISLMATRGYAAPEVERTHKRSRELCLKLNETRRLFPVLWGLWTCHLIAGDMKKSLAVAEEMSALADTVKDPAALVESLHATGTTLAFMGRLTEARRYLERILELYQANQSAFHASMYVLDPCVTSLSMLGRCLTLLGYLDQGLDRTRQAVELANKLTHPQSLAYATFWTGWAHQMRGEHDAACARLEAAMKLSKEQGLFQILEWGRIVRGAALCSLGELEQGIAEKRRSLAAQRRMRSELNRPYCLLLLADALRRQGALEEALAAVTEALDIIGNTDERADEPEAYRLRAELLMAGAGGPERVAEAEASLEKALELARLAQSRTLELRAAVTHCRLNAAAGAHVLRDVLNWFTEGLDTPELAEARKLLGGAR